MAWASRNMPLGALKEIRKFAMKEMGAPDVRIDTRLNKAVWARGKRNGPYRIRVRSSRKQNEDEDSLKKLYTLLQPSSWPSSHSGGPKANDLIEFHSRWRGDGENRSSMGGHHTPVCWRSFSTQLGQSPGPTAPPLLSPRLQAGPRRGGAGRAAPITDFRGNYFIYTEQEESSSIIQADTLKVIICVNASCTITFL
ncbi:60S ribosomal protein L31 [Tupaia chinensis]|uniref:Large ribosomal subunit protein eL31 n=1 Tax=Tupaia chinensis TaxID=246437 RepID=L9JBH4_TUPCH|nr:60S ribosomal protein L31 [Tupaia chinensis]